MKCIITDSLVSGISLASALLKKAVSSLVEEKLWGELYCHVTPFNPKVPVDSWLFFSV